MRDNETISREHLPTILDALRQIGRPATVGEIAQVSNLSIQCIGTVIDYATGSLRTSYADQSNRQVVEPTPGLRYWWGWN